MPKINLPKCVMKPQDGKHYYDTDFGLFPSVTTILKITTPQSDKDSLQRWIDSTGESVSNYIKDMAAGIGTVSHWYNEVYLAKKYGLPVPSDEDINTYHYNRYKLFGRAHHTNCRPFLDTVQDVYGLEQAVFSKKLKLAGTIDCIGMINNEICIIDYKTKRSPQKQEYMTQYFLQGALYTQMWNEHTIPKYHVTKIMIVASSEHHTLQVFPAKPDDYIQEALQRVDQYYDMADNGLV